MVPVTGRPGPGNRDLLGPLHRSAPRRWLSRIGLPALLLSVSACMGQVPPPRVAHLRVEAVPADTTVYINGRYVASARVLAKKAKRLSPGVKYITFVAPGHFPHDVRLDLPSGETTLKMKLRPIPE